jgi:hypothetical protein
MRAALLTGLLLTFGCGGPDEELGEELDESRPGDDGCPDCFVGASSIVSYQPGPLVAAPYSNAKNALGKRGTGETNIYTSLGSQTGVLIVRMSTAIRDQQYYDLFIWASTRSGEQYQVSVSKDGTSWTVIGNFSGVAGIDLRLFGLGGSASYWYVRLRNSSGITGSSPEAGPDIDAILVPSTIGSGG